MFNPKTHAMNWFSKIIGQNKSNPVSPNGTVTDLLANTSGNVIPTVPEELFADHRAPEPEPVAQNHGGENISLFLNQNFYGTGYHDGYNYHTPEMMANRIKCIKADFRMQVDLAIDRKRKSLLDLRLHNIDYHSHDEKMIRRIEAVESDFLAMISRLENEKALSAEEEGWVMKPVHDYRDGFLRGADAYNDEKLIALTTGLFN